MASNSEMGKVPPTREDVLAFERFRQALDESRFPSRILHAVNRMHEEGQLKVLADLSGISDLTLTSKPRIGPKALTLIREQYPYNPNYTDQELSKPPRNPWEPKPPIEPGPRMQNVRISDDKYGTLFTGDGATFNFGEEYRKGQKIGDRFDAVYIKLIGKDNTLTLAKYEAGGSRGYIFEQPTGEISYVYFGADELRYQEGELDGYSFTIGENGISEILVTGWGDIPEIVVPMLPYNSLAHEFDSKVSQAAERNS